MATHYVSVLYAGEETLAFMTGLFSSQSIKELTAVNLLLSKKCLEEHTKKLRKKRKNERYSPREVSIVTSDIIYDGITRLHDAAKYGMVNRIVKYIEHFGIEPKDKWGNTPLHYAVKEQTPSHEAVIRVLIEHGAQVNAKNFKQQTAWSIAYSRNYTNLCRLLVEFGATVHPIGKTRNRSGTY